MFVCMLILKVYKYLKKLLDFYILYWMFMIFYLYFKFDNLVFYDGIRRKVWIKWNSNKNSIIVIIWIRKEKIEVIEFVIDWVLL